jgi:hypothetical protein
MARKIIPIGKATIGIKCGDCIHYKRMQKFGKPCSELGRKHFADAPDCYAPDVYLLARHNSELLFNLALLYKDFTSQETRVFMSLLKKSKTFEKVKLHFGMPVYFCIGNDYLGNYYRGFVLNVTTQSPQLVYVTSDLAKAQRNKPMIGTFLRDSIYTATEFAKRKVRLQKAGKLVDPKPNFQMEEDDKVLAKLDYNPPSMDSAPKEWFDKAKKSAKVTPSAKKRLDGTLVFNV